MSRVYLIFLPVLILYGPRCYSQDSLADFFVSSTACLEESLDLKNSSTNATTFSWDFCPDDFLTYKTTLDLGVVSGLISGFGYKLVESNGLWFGFVTSRDNNKLFRLDYGSDPTGFPTITDLGNPDGKLVFPEGIDLVEANGNWFGFIGSLDFSSPTQGIIRLDFGNSLMNAPTASNLGNFGYNTRFRDLKVIKQGVDLVLTLSNYNANSLIRVNFRDDFNNTISPSEIFDSGPLAGVSLPVGMDVVKKNSDWVMLVASLGNNKIIQINFGPDILSIPRVDGNYSFAGVSIPYKVKLSQVADEFFAIVGNESAPIVIINFKDLDPVNAPIQLNHLGLPALLAIESTRYHGISIVGGVGLSDNLFREVIFESSCGANKNFSLDESPTGITYSQFGSKKIELVVKNESLQSSSIAYRLLTISALTAPDISFTSQNVCANNDVNFTSVNVSGDITDYNWDFDDTNTSMAQDPVHQFIAAGNYEVKLQVTASNGCNNLARKTVTIYNEPVASFDLPSTSPICTNQDYLFNNTSTFDPDSNPSWQWEINGSPTSLNQNLTYTIPTATIQSIKLIASIPGCSSEVTKTINTVEDGPLVDFSFSNDCEDKSIVFTNATVGTVTGYSWNFGDGNNSIQTNPSNSFVDFGNYDVKLVASNLAGCMNTVTKPIQIYSKPQPDFSLDLPPFSCNGSASQFNDLTPNPTDSNLDSWTWSFGDPSNGTSTTRNPQYVYADADQYEVNLDVTTNFGCTTSIQKTVTISPSPNADFTFNTACVNQSTLFTPLSTTGVDSWQWKIGTSTYNQQSPTHVFGSSSNYNVRLTATGSNGCVAVIDKMINVPIPGNVNFSSLNNCTNQNTLFTDLTVAGSDPITSRLWQFGSIGSASGATPSFTFPLPGSYPTQLTVTDASGCSYSISKIVNITESPAATFTATPQVGAPPLTVQLKNTTGNSVLQSWSVDGVGTLTSTEVAPSFVFDALGDYTVDLTVEDESGCISETSKIISVIIPELDIELTSLSLVPTSTGESNILLTLKNNSNFPVNNIKAVIDISGEALIDETIAATIQPNDVYSQILSTGIISSKNGGSYLCVELVVDGETDTENNKKCVNNEATAVVLAPYPNPGSSELHLEWISAITGNAEINIFDPTGRKVFGNTFSDLEVGLNRATISLTSFHPGIYYVFFVSGGIRKSFPFVVRK